MTDEKSIDSSASKAAQGEAPLLLTGGRTEGAVSPLSISQPAQLTRTEKTISVSLSDRQRESEREREREREMEECVGTMTTKGNGRCGAICQLQHKRSYY
ncbi:hypothetical protein AOLI_G00284010 [Acnodon oligacanthus]